MHETSDACCLGGGNHHFRAVNICRFERLLRRCIDRAGDMDHRLSALHEALH